MKKTKHFISVLVVCVFALLFYGSATNKGLETSIKVPVKTASYDYVPAEAQTKANIALALVKPRFARSMTQFDCKLFQDFSDHAAGDFEELITKRGFTLRGPFQGVDDMVFSDKQACFLYLQPEIEISMDFSNVTWHRQTSTNYVYGGRFENTYTYWFDGSVTLSGRINLIFAEPFTKEKIQTLAISIPQKIVTIKSTTAYPEDDVFSAVRRHEDPGLINPMITALEECYQSAFATAYNHLDPKEIERYINDAKAARDNHH